ncbi:hypothetical protein TNCV_4887221 [Trichonephila clavipes]|nr:hypothetical protein TNCV_4887221 [Trichonephila clavipes]
MQENSNRQHERNNSTQQEKTTQLSSRNETSQLSRKKQLNSSVGKKQLNSALLSTAYYRLQTPAPPTTAYNRLHRLYSRIVFFTYYWLSNAAFDSLIDDGLFNFDPQLSCMLRRHLRPSYHLFSHLHSTNDWALSLKDSTCICP